MSGSGEFSLRIATSIALALACSASGAASSRKPDPAMPVPGLTLLELKHEGVRVWYAADRAKPVPTPPEYLKSYEEAGVHASQPLLLDLGHGLPPLALTCDSGPSADPTCRLLARREDPLSTVFESSGTGFVFTPDGDIRVSGQSDSMYDHRRLFRYDGKRFNEVAQPFRYVGIEGRTTAPLALASAIGGGADGAIATLKPGTSVTILLNAASEDNDRGWNPDYLVKTREGLVGWARIPTQPDGKTIVEGLHFNGD